MRYEFSIFFRKRNILFVCLLGVFALIYTFVYFAALADTIHSYSLIAHFGWAGYPSVTISGVFGSSTQYVLN